MTFEEKVKKICESESAFQNLIHKAFGGQEDKLVSSMLSQFELANLRILQSILDNVEKGKSGSIQPKVAESFAKWITENRKFFEKYVLEQEDFDGTEPEDVEVQDVDVDEPVLNEELFQYGYELISLLEDQGLYPEIEIVEPDNEYFEPEKFKAFVTTVDNYKFVLELETVEYEDEEMASKYSEELPQDQNSDQLSNHLNSDEV